MKKAAPEFQHQDCDCEPTDLPLRDLERARTIAGGDAALATRMFELMLQDLSAQLDNIRCLQKRKDWPALKQSVHRLRGSVTYCAVPALEFSLCVLEAAASGQSDDIERHIRALTIEVESLLATTRLPENSGRSEGKTD